jgi:hypothetical protein
VIRDERHVELARALRRDQRIVDRQVGQCIAPHFIELGLDVGCFAFVTRRKAFAILDALDKVREACRRAGKDGLRRAGERCTALLQRQQRLLERARRRRDQRNAAGPVNSAQRVACADHCDHRHVIRIELQDRHFVLQDGDVLIGLVAEDPPQRGRQRDRTHGHFLGLDRRRQFRRARRVGQQHQLRSVWRASAWFRHAAVRRGVVGDDAQHRLRRIAQIGRQANVDRLAPRFLEHRDRRPHVVADRCAELRKLDQLEIGYERCIGR